MVIVHQKGLLQVWTGEMLAYFRPVFIQNDLDTVQLLKRLEGEIRFLN